MDTIYINIKRLLKGNRRVNQNDISDALGVSRNTVSNWLNKKIGLKAEQVPELAKLFRVSVASLYGEEGLRKEEATSEERISFQVDFQQKELDKKDKRIEALIRENERLKNAVPSKVKYGQVAEE